MASRALQLAVDARMIAHSGIGTYLRNVLSRLSDDPGLSITCLGDGRELGKHAWSSKVRCVEFKAPIYSMREQAGLALRAPACDVFWSPHVNVPLLPVQARKRLATIHDAFHLAFPNMYGGAKGVYARLLYRRAVRSDAVITVSEFSRTELVRLLGSPGREVHVVPNGIDPSIASDFPLKPIVGDYLLFVGNLKPHKNLKNAIMAFQSLIPKFPSLRFVIVGKREGLLTLDNDLESLLSRSQQGKIELKGEVALTELQNYYRYAKAFVFPSLYEGFGLPILEAMCFGLPIAASDRGPLREVGGGAITYFDPENPDDMAAKLEAVLRAPRPSQEAYHTQLAGFSWERSAQRHARIIRDLAESDDVR